MSKPFRILVASVGQRVELVQRLRRDAQDLGLTPVLIGTDIVTSAPAWHICDIQETALRIEEDAYVEQLLELCQRHQVDLLVPTHDAEIPKLAAARDVFSSLGTTVHVGSPQMVEICARKDATHRFLTQQGFPTPRQITLEGIEANPGAWPFPLFAKPVDGSRSVGAMVVKDLDELRRLARSRSYIAQTIALGHEYTVSVYVDRRGRCRCAVPRRRLVVRDGEVSKGMAVRNPQIQDTAKAIAEALPGAWGAFCIQMFFDPKSKAIEVIEINPRFGGGFPLAHEAGARHTRFLIEECLGMECSADWDGWTHGKVMMRYTQAIYREAKELDMEVE